MSEMETVSGTLKKIPTPSGLPEKKVVDYLINSGFSFDMDEYANDFYTSEELIKVGNDWYQWLRKDALDPCGDLSVTHNGDGTVSFYAHWYNGGGSLEEVLEGNL